MGDGGVACMPLQHSNIMERFTIQDKTISTTTATPLCNGGKSNGSINSNNNSSSNNNNNSSNNNNNSSNNNNNNNNNSNTKNVSGSGSNEFNSKPKRVVKKVIKVRKVVTVKKVAADKREFGLEKGAKSKKEALEKEAKSSQEGPEKEGKSSKDGLEKDAKVGKVVEKGLTSTDSKVLNSKEEVEEGELGTLKWPPKSEIENGEIVPPEKPRRSEIEKGEIGAEKWRKGEAEKSDIISSKWQKGDSLRDEIEKGEFIPDRWHSKDEYNHVKSRGRYDSSSERIPSSGKYSIEDVYRRKEFNRSAGNQQHAKSSLRWESGQDRNMKMSSKIVDEEGSYKGCEYNGKNHGRDYTSANRLKRHGFDSDCSERKHLGDYEDYAGIKSRRLSEDSTRSAHSEYYLHHSVERYPRHSGSSKISSDKYSSKHHELILSSKVVYDRHARSPCHFERSPRDRSRCHDHRDRSPFRRERSPYSRERSPHVSERSPYVHNKSPYRREKSPQGREKSPYSHERSPYDRSHHSDRRKRSPTCSERSPRDRVGYHDRRDRASIYLERSPLDRSRPNSREVSRKGGTSEKRGSQRSSKEQEDKLSHKDSNGRDSQISVKESQDRSNMHDFNVSDEKNVIYDFHKDEESQGTDASGIKSSHVDGPPPEELLSMEEDMDICDTPPHVQVVSDSSMGKWFYLDYFGMECGPSKLCDLRALVDDGVLVSDHLIKHLDGDRWVTIENAVSPLVTVNYASIVSNATTQRVNPPEAPGNLLAVADTVDICHSSSKSGEEVSLSDEIAAASEPSENLHIDERVRALLDGFTVSPGRELETIGEVLQTTFQRVPWDGVDNLEGFTSHPAGIAEQLDQCGDKLSNYSYKVHGFSYFADSADWFSGRWSCKGGDWKRNDEAVQDRFPRRKFVLNDGFPLCQMPKSGSEDPRWHSKDDLYYPSQSRRLDLPSWAYSCADDRSECGVGRSSLMKPPTIRGVKGTALSVVRINACVVKDHGSIVSETRMKGRAKDRHSAKSARAHSSNNDVKRSHAEGDLLCRSVSDKDGSLKPAALVNAPKDRLCMVDELQLHLGEWYYLDAAGHEQGPSSFSELQVLADKGAIQKHSSVFRKIDRLWVPVSSGTKTSGPMVETQQENVVPSDSYSNTISKLQSDANNRCCANSSLFHSQHPQFIGYMRGKLHQLVMKSYKSREFAAAINEVLDPWINGKQPKKDIDKHMYHKLEIDAHSGKRVRMLIDDSDEDYKIEEDLQWAQKDETSFEELCGDATFYGEGRAYSEPEMGGWGLLDGHVLAQIFHFLRSDIKALAFASLTCKHWRAAVNFYKDISRKVNFSSVGPNCTDAMIWGVMNGYNKERLNSMVLVGCTNVTSGMLEDILRSFPSISSVDIRGCSQFMDLALQFPNLNWLKGRNFRRTGTYDESHSKIRSLKQISERTATFYKKKGGDTEDFGELKEYFDSVKKRDSNQLFRRSLYKRSKLFDARRSSSIPSRDARIRQWAIKQSKTHYKRMEGFLAVGLKDIMKENTFDFFVPKVAEIEERMKNGYYIGHGLRSVREDISRMCRDAIKAKNRGAGDMNHIIELFLCLASHLEESSKFSYERDELMKSWKDKLSTGLGSSTLKHKKKLVNERKYMSRSNGSTLVNGSLDYGEYASDREIKRRLSKLNRKSMDSGSETSDDIDRSSEDGRTDDEMDSDTESDLDFQSEGQTWDSKGNGYVMIDDGYSVTDEREWGARMTKASLVPPVTRKYEIIDQYVIVADEENVQRKMCVSLPDDYAEKLDAQRNGTEELDMELPEVKDYKPRKQLGDEVLEQEVYGIDPHTYNLLLDSMPEELNWTLSEKQLFIEDVLLRTLNKQVRHFTGSGNTPMIYSLKPVVEEIEIAAEEDCDMRKMKMSQAILKAIDSRPDDKYVAYRKGLGVVCNKEGGFGKDDFVVEFLGEVYPAWKWFEKQDGIRSLQKDSKDPAPEFYNIYLERPKGDADGYDLVVVDAMHKANYASRICHSCRPNCEAKVTAVDGHYQIGIYTLCEVQNGEEITFDYNSVTESKEEYEASVCLCGSQGCRGSYLNLTGEGAFQKVFKEWHGILDRHYLMLEACQLNSVSEEDYLDLGRAGLGSCLLGGLPDWLVAYAARLVRFINLERTKLPEEILRYNLEEKRKYLIDTCLEVERSDAELQAEGVYNQRLQNLAVTLDKVSYVMRCVFDDPKKVLPPLERLSPEETVSFLWKGEGSLVDQLLQCMAPHIEPDTLSDLKSKIRAHDPTSSGNIQKDLQKSLLWLRDEVRRLPCMYKCRHDAAADLIHVYAYTKCFFRVREYKTFTSLPVYISPLDLGPKYADKLGSGIHEYKKTYGENYCVGQLIFWHIQTNLEPDCSLEKASRGCLSLPDIGSFYAKVQKPSQQRIYGPKTVKMMLERMEKYPQKPWPKDQIWSFKSSPKVFGSPMFDCILNNTSLDKEMVHWLKHRPAVYQAMWDR